MNNDSTVTLELGRSISLSIRKHLYLFFKRLADILISFIGIVFLIPLIIIVKIVYMLGGDFNSIFFKHTRIGKDGQVFKMYKFRTMVPNAEEILKTMLKNKKVREEWEENHKLDNDPRITKLGGILRKTSLDEIPQVLNIFKGDMSIIGPRPLIQEEVDDYGRNKSKLLSVRPGLTGWWACNGRSCTSTKDRRNLELYYVDHCSILLDIKVVFRTIVTVIKREGAK